MNLRYLGSLDDCILGCLTFSKALKNELLLYELHKTAVVERECLGHDERSEECSKERSSTICFVKRV
jgi:hypothetical protein